MGEKKIKKKKVLLIITAAFIAVLTLIMSLTGALNIVMSASTAEYIFSPDTPLPDDMYDCILVLGAGVRDSKPSDMLRDRLLAAIELYNNGYAEKILMSGDHENDDYDEVGVMKEFAEEQGVPSDDILLDRYGLSTYDSMYRAKEIFGIGSMIVVTQEYHLCRALYIADRIGIDVVGVYADTRDYAGSVWRGAREIAARAKDFFKCIFKPEAKYTR